MQTEIEDHVIKVYKRMYDMVKGRANVRFDSDDARGMMTQAAARLTQVVIQTERDGR